MQRADFWRLWVLLAATAWPLAAIAQLVPLGPALELDRGATARAAIDSRGRSMVVWDQNNSPFGLAQTFDERGRTVRDRFKALVPSRGRDVVFSDVAADDSGSFLLLWEHLARQSSDFGVTVGFFDPLGEPETAAADLLAWGPESNLSDFTTIRNPAGDAWVLWVQSEVDQGERDRWKIRGQRFDFRNRALGVPATLLKAPRDHNLDTLEAGIDDRGRSTVFWRQSRPAVAESRPHFIQRFRRNGEKLGARKLVLRSDGIADFAMDPSGAFVVVWQNLDRSLDARWFDRLGRPLGGPLRVDAADPGNRPFDVVKDRFGNTVVLWSLWEHPLEPGKLHARVFDPTGSAVGEVVDLGPGNFVSLDVNRQGTVIVVSTLRKDRRQDTVVVRRFELTCAPGYESRCPDL